VPARVIVAFFSFCVLYSVPCDSKEDKYAHAQDSIFWQPPSYSLAGYLKVRFVFFINCVHTNSCLDIDFAPGLSKLACFGLLVGWFEWHEAEGTNQRNVVLSR